MEKTKICVVIALAIGGAMGCSSDEPAAEAEYPQPAASIGDEVTPEEVTPAEPASQPEAAQIPPTSAEDRQAAQMTTPVTPPQGALEEEETVAESLRDAQIVKIADLANAGEVEQAKLAKTKAQNPRVKKFAAMMVTDHTKAKQKGMQLSKSADIVAEESNIAGELETKSSQVLDTLRAVDASSFDNAYMSAQVQQHQEVLEMLNTKLIPSATNPKLKTELEATRTMVQKHLGEAQQIHQSLASD